MSRPVAPRWFRPSDIAVGLSIAAGTGAALALTLIETIRPPVVYAALVAATALLWPASFVRSWKMLALWPLIAWLVGTAGVVMYAHMVPEPKPHIVLLAALLSGLSVLPGAAFFAPPVIAAVRARRMASVDSFDAVVLACTVWLTGVGVVSTAVSWLTRDGTVPLPFAAGGETTTLQMIPFGLAVVFSLWVLVGTRRGARRPRLLLVTGVLGVALASLVLVSMDDAARAPLTAIRDVEMGYYHSCARGDRGAVYCWGDGQRGELGHDGGGNELLAHRVLGIDGAQDLALGDSFSCVVDPQGEVLCWGALEAETGEPVRVTGVHHVAQIAAQRDYACARDEEGAVACWGSPSAGEEAAPPIARPIELSAPALDIAVGESGACALLATHLQCWGFFCGSKRDCTECLPETIQWPEAEQMVSVVLHEKVVCLRSQAAELWCHEAPTLRPTEMCVPSLQLPFPSGSNVDAVAAAGGTRCVRSHGVVRCRRQDGFGPEFPELTGVLDFEVDAGGDNLCLVTEQHTVQCLGRYNRYGQFGDGTRRPRASPVTVLQGL